MKLQVQDASEFHRLLGALVDELVDAQINLRLHQDLTASVRDYAREFGQSNTFWSLTFQAHLDAAVFRLCKAYDQNNTSLNLKNLLDTVSANLHLFDEAEFRERLKGNPFVDSLAATSRRPDTAQLQTDLEFVSNANPLVKKLTIWRNNFYAHRSPTYALDPGSLAKRFPLSVSDVDVLSQEGVRIVNRYSVLFIATTHSTTIVGHDDYRSVL